MSKDPANDADFSEKVFDWKSQHRPEINSRLVETGGQGGPNGGILRPEREAPLARQHDPIR